MISQRAITGFDKIFSRSMDESLRTEIHPAWNIQPVDAKIINARQFIMLTISSYDFRLIVLLHFSSDPVSISYVADNLKISSDELTASRYQDYLSEIGNILCGSIKRLLFQTYPHLGMSSPNRMNSESLKYINSYRIDHASHISAKSGNGPMFYGSLYISSVGNLDFDPAALTATEEKVEMGALELF